ncbi:MAG: hypothetical protein AB8E82_20875 [Aureispira sp.]
MQNSIVLTFKKVFKNYSEFIYYTESERLIDRIVERFGYDDREGLKYIKEDFVYGDKQVDISWAFDGGVIKLEKDEDTKRPILSYFIALNQTKEKSDEQSAKSQ